MTESDRPERHAMPIDSDVDVSMPEQRQELRGSSGRVLGVIALGGVIGALARYQLGKWWPAPIDAFPAATLTINLLGCLLIGVLMVLIADLGTRRPLVRPFLGTGVLGGFTTFSTYAVDLQTLIGQGRADTALGYLAATAVGAVAAVTFGMFLARRVPVRRLV